jgi:hypothetical protein
MKRWEEEVSGVETRGQAVLWQLDLKFSFGCWSINPFSTAVSGRPTLSPHVTSLRSMAAGLAFLAPVSGERQFLEAIAQLHEISVTPQRLLGALLRLGHAQTTNMSLHEVHFLFHFICYISFLKCGCYHAPF